MIDIEEGEYLKTCSYILSPIDMMFEVSSYILKLKKKRKTFMDKMEEEPMMLLLYLEFTFSRRDSVWLL